MLLPGVDEEGAKVVIEKVKNTLAAQDFVYQGKKLIMEFNIAAVTRREEDLNLQDMMQEGEVELFRVKQAKLTTPQSV